MKETIQMPSANAQGNNELEMTAVSVFYDAGVNPLRKEATRKAVQHWMLQSHLPKEFLFIELGFDGQFTFSPQDFPEQIHYIRIDGTERNKYLFQKEHLWNIAAKMATYEKLMFIDSDVSPLDDQDWFFKAYKALDKCLFTQGFSIIHYLDESDKPTWLNKISYTSSFIQKNEINPAYGVPCGVFCIDKNTLQAIGWFNGSPIGIGDVLLWYEMTGKTTPGSEFICSLFNRQNVKTMFYAIQMAENKHLMQEVFVDIAHFYHGPFENRSYEQRDKMWLTQYPWMGRILRIGDLGLMEWMDVDHWFFRVMSQFSTICDDQQVVNQLFSGHFNYIGFIREFNYDGIDRLNDLSKIRLNLTRLILKYTIN